MNCRRAWARQWARIVCSSPGTLVALAVVFAPVVYGGLIPVSETAQGLAVLEAITGQF
jgi:hypothetical protein